MKLLILPILELTLQGCFFQQVHSKDLEKGARACEKHGGVYMYRSWWLNVTNVYCRDGSSYEL